MTFKPSIFTITIVASLFSACQNEPVKLVHEWGLKAQSDLTIAHNIMLDSHPGPVDKENPWFNKQADAAYEHAMKLAGDVTDQPGYGAVLLAYTAGFRDGHFGVYPVAQMTGDANFSWPGMIPSWRADKVKIIHTASNEQAFLGAELLSCDDRTPNDIILENVFQFSSGKPDQDAYWARNAYNIFLDDKNPLVKLPQNCAFKLSNGETLEHNLNWRAAPDDVLNTHRWKAVFDMRPDIGIEEIRPGEFWINLSDFSPNEEGVAKNRAIFAEVIKRRNEIRNAKSIVFDMRGNQGGSSAWGIEMTEALWGEAFLNALRSVPDETYVEWRLSKDNVEYLGWIENYLIENGHTDMAENYFRPIKEGAQIAFAEGHDLYREPDFDDDNDTELDKRSDVPNLVNTPVYVLTHGTCASACLDFVDILLEIDGVTHIGYPTSSDTNYMEIRMVDLPSGDAKMAIPTKVYRNRKRASGEYYEPEFRYDGFDWSDEAIKEWAKTITDQKTK